MWPMCRSDYTKKRKVGEVRVRIVILKGRVQSKGCGLFRALARATAWWDSVDFCAGLPGARSAPGRGGIILPAAPQGSVYDR